MSSPLLSLVLGSSYAVDGTLKIIELANLYLQVEHYCAITSPLESSTLLGHHLYCQVKQFCAINFATGLTLLFHHQLYSRVKHSCLTINFTHESNTLLPSSSLLTSQTLLCHHQLYSRVKHSIAIITFTRVSNTLLPLHKFSKVHKSTVPHSPATNL